MLYRYDDVAYDNSVSSRQLTWQAAWQLISEEGWTGVGSGDSQKALNAHYEAIGYKQGVAENHNAHNQYLQIIIEGRLYCSLHISQLLYLLYMECKKNETGGLPRLFAHFSGKYFHRSYAGSPKRGHILCPV
jgi:hypothetical protein